MSNRDFVLFASGNRFRSDQCVDIEYLDSAAFDLELLSVFENLVIRSHARQISKEVDRAEIRAKIDVLESVQTLRIVVERQSPRSLAEVRVQTMHRRVDAVDILISHWGADVKVKRRQA